METGDFTKWPELTTLIEDVKGGTDRRPSL